ncbi:MAG: thymidine phosphorylase [Verrucomicrobiae bacterium]|nr:thymidine phosphorylase [Verrucomicrobiae bacterium]
MHVPSLIEKKREGGILTDDEIRAAIAAFTSGDLPDYQMSALAMAIYFRGMSPEETASLTRAMLESGEVFRYPPDHPPIVDKHSTGGIGDKVSLVLAPLLACDELWVPMISGRGLGITGGTLDKLEAIPGFNVNVTQADALSQLQRIGVVMMGQTTDICPADKKLYALRDVSGTVPSIPLIVASIMSKKLAETLDRLVLDVKYGSGAFMKTETDAVALADAMREVGEAMGVAIFTELNPMNEPLGRTVGNALEVQEAIDTLRGDGPADLVAITLDLASRVSDVSREQLARWLDDGTAWEKFVQLVEAQDGDVGCLERYSAVHPAPVRREIVAGMSGRVTQVDAHAIGHASLELGAGRSRADDAVDFSVGFSHLTKCGTTVTADQIVGIIHARSESDADQAEHGFRAGLTIT